MGDDYRESGSRHPVWARLGANSPALYPPDHLNYIDPLRGLSPNIQISIDHTCQFSPLKYPDASTQKAHYTDHRIPSQPSSSLLWLSGISRQPISTETFSHRLSHKILSSGSLSLLCPLRGLALPQWYNLVMTWRTGREKQPLVTTVCASHIMITKYQDTIGHVGCRDNCSPLPLSLHYSTPSLRTHYKL